MVRRQVAHRQRVAFNVRNPLQQIRQRELKRRVFRRAQRRTRRARRRVVHTPHRQRHLRRVRTALTVRHRVGEAVATKVVRSRRVGVARPVVHQRPMRGIRERRDAQRVTARIRVVRQQRSLRERHRRLFHSPARVIPPHRRRTQHLQVARRQARRPRQARKLHRRSTTARAVRVVKQITRRAVVDNPDVASRRRVRRATLERRRPHNTRTQRPEHRVLQLNHIRTTGEPANRVNVVRPIQPRREHIGVSVSAAHQRVSPKAAVQRVSTPVTRQHVHQRVTHQHVSRAAARHVLNRGQTVLLTVNTHHRHRLQRRQIRRHTLKLRHIRARRRRRAVSPATRTQLRKLGHGTAVGQRVPSTTQVQRPVPKQRVRRLTNPNVARRRRLPRKQLRTVRQMTRRQRTRTTAKRNPKVHRVRHIRRRVRRRRHRTTHRRIDRANVRHKLRKRVRITLDAVVQRAEGRLQI